MTTLWLDASAGMAGDMMMGALIDAGAGIAGLQAAVDAVIPGSVRLTAAAATRQGMRATKAGVETLVDDPPHRTWASIRAMLDQADLASMTKARAVAVFEAIARAEGHVHGVGAGRIHFHEVGALDSIADVVACCEGLRLLGVDRVVATPVAVGAGEVQAAHGLMPVPVPAVAQLALGWPTTAGVVPTGHHRHDHGDGHTAEHAAGHFHDHDGAGESLPGELCTPTGMALVTVLADRPGLQPAMTTRAIGVGAGTKDTPGRPNAVRVLVGEENTQPLGADEVCELAANVDDLDPRVWPEVLAALLDEGAFDAWIEPALMKRGRPAHVLHVLCAPAQGDALSGRVMALTSTFGVRRYAGVVRDVLARDWRTVSVGGHELRVKIGRCDGTVVQVQPEFDDARALAERLGRPVADVLASARAAAEEAGLRPGEGLGRQ